MLTKQKERLTAREQQVLQLRSAGFTYREVALVLGISAYTVGTHIKNLYRKLGVHKAAAAVVQAHGGIGALGS